MKDKILAVLKENENRFVSGQFICEGLGVSRAAIWKYIKKLKDEGYKIESISRNGYKLTSSADLLVFQEVEKHLDTKYIGRNIIHFDTINSTNIKAKEIASEAMDGTLVISEEQTLGKGRFGRHWSSPKAKGIWMSIILKPDMDPSNASNITLIGAAAVCEAMKSLGVEVQIKWPNDIILNHKKLAGILTEMSSELNLINYIIIGMGINVNNTSDDFPEELTTIATSLKVEQRQDFSRQELVGLILNSFEKLYEEFIDNNDLSSTIRICKANSLLLGREIQLYSRGNLITVKAIDISPDGLLVVEHENGKIEKIISGEVSMHGLNL